MHRSQFPPASDVPCTSGESAHQGDDQIVFFSKALTWVSGINYNYTELTPDLPAGDSSPSPETPEQS